MVFAYLWPIILYGRFPLRHGGRQTKTACAAARLAATCLSGKNDENYQCGARTLRSIFLEATVNTDIPFPHINIPEVHPQRPSVYLQDSFVCCFHSIYAEVTLIV